MGMQRGCANAFSMGDHICALDQAVEGASLVLYAGSAEPEVLHTGITSG